MKKKKKKKGFTLVELLAVIVVLAIILVIAVPKILDVIKSSRENSLISSVKLIARNAEQKLLTNEVLGESADTLSCAEVADVNTTDYRSCTISVNDDTKEVTVTIEGQGKFNGYTCSGTKNNVTCGDSEEETLVYLSPIWKDIVYETIYNEIAASSTSNILFDINPTPLYEQNFQTNLVEIDCNSGYLMGKIDFYTIKNVPSGITSNPYVDVSLGNDNTVKAYYKENSLLISPCRNTLYNVYIVGDGIISFPEDSTELFSYLEYVKNINFNSSIDTSNVTCMESMFERCESLEELDLSSFDTKNVTNMHYIFFHCESLNEITGFNHLNFDSIDISAEGMAIYCGPGAERLNSEINDFIEYFSNSTGISINNLYCPA